MKNFKKIIVLWFVILTIYSCERNESVMDEFEFPILTNSNFIKGDSSIKHNEEYISGTFPIFYGKYSFRRNIDIANWRADTTYQSDFYRGFGSDSNINRLDESGFELYVDYDQTFYFKTRNHRIAMEYYPVYIVNSTNNDKVFYGKDSYIFGIQEGVDKRNWPYWKPIEARGFDFCGNGSWKLVVHPNEFILVLMQKYEGDFETDLRVRIKNSDNILVSKPFKGTINRNQFRVEKGSYIESQIEKDNLFSLFYGAVPLNEDDLLVE